VGVGLALAAAIGLKQMAREQRSALLRAHAALAEAFGSGA